MLSDLLFHSFFFFFFFFQAEDGIRDKLVTGVQTCALPISYPATPVAGYVGCCHAIPQINLTGRLKEVKCPSLVIVGEQDAGTPVAMAREIQPALPGSELAAIPSASHLSNLEQPTPVNRALATFLT